MMISKNSVRENLIYSFVLNCITLLVSLVLFTPFFEEVDDVTLAMLSEGAYGERDAHLIYSNYLLGLLQKALQSVISGIRWHTVLQYVFIFVSLLLLVYVLLHYQYGKIISVLIELAVAYELYVSLQFTKTATWIAAVSVLVLLLLADDILPTQRTEKRVICTASAILFVYATLLRQESVLIACGILGLAGLCSFVRRVITKGNIKSYFYYFVPLMIVIVVGYISNIVVYKSDDEWKAYQEYNQARVLLQDYRYDAFDYTKNAESLRAVGVSKNDALMYMVCLLPDPTDYSADRIRSIIDAQPPKHFGLATLKAWVQNIYESYFMLNALMISVVLMWIVILLLKPKRLIPEIGLNLVSIALLSLYFQYSGRWSHRLAYTLLLIELLWLLYMLICQNPEEKFPRNVVKVAVCLITFCNVGHLLGNVFDSNAYWREREARDYSVLQEYVEEHKDILFCYDTFTVQDAFKYDVFKPFRLGQLDNVVYCGYGLTNSPVVNAVTNRYGYSSPIRALSTGNDNVILVDNYYPEQKMLYLTEHAGGQDYSLLLTEDISGYNLFRIKSEEN